MFGAGFGGSGDSYYTTLGLLGLDGYTAGLNRAALAWDNVERAQGRAATAPGLKMQAAGGALLGASAIAGRGLFNLGKDALQFNNRMELVKVGFKTMLGSADAADKKIRELQMFAAKTQFNFQDSAKAGQTLLAMGFSGKRLIPLMSSVGNAVTAAGGDVNTFTRSLLVLGKIKTTGFLSSVRLNQLAANGIPAMQILRKELNLTAKDMEHIGKLKIPASKAIDALTRGFDKRYAGALEAGAKTTPGKISNAEDAIERAKTLIGSDISGDVGKGAEAVTRLIEKFEKLNPAIRKTLVYGAGFGVLATGIAGAGLIIAGSFANVRSAAALTTIANGALARSVEKDIVVEVAKGRVARGHAGGLRGVGRAAKEAATDVTRLATANALPWGSPAARVAYPTMYQAGGRALGASPLLPMLAQGAGSAAATSAFMGAGRGYRWRGVNGRFLPNSAVPYSLPSTRGTGVWNWGRVPGGALAVRNAGETGLQTAMNGGALAMRSGGASQTINATAFAQTGRGFWNLLGRSAVLRGGLAAGVGLGTGAAAWRLGKDTGLIGKDTRFGLNTASALTTGLGAGAAYGANKLIPVVVQSITSQAGSALTVGQRYWALRQFVALSAQQRATSLLGSRVGALVGRGVFGAGGRATPSALLGFYAGRGASMDLQKAGYGRAGSNAYGTATGLGVAALGMWNPLTMLGAGVGLGARHIINRSYTDPLEAVSTGRYYNEAGNQTREGATAPLIYNAARQERLARMGLRGRVTGAEYGEEASTRSATAQDLIRRADEVQSRNVSGGTRSWRRVINLFKTRGDWSLSTQLADDEVRDYWGYTAEAMSLRQAARTQRRHALSASREAMARTQAERLDAMNSASLSEMNLQREAANRLSYAKQGRDYDAEKMNEGRITNMPTAKGAKGTVGYYATLAQLGYKVPKEQQALIDAQTRNERTPRSDPNQHERSVWGEFEAPTTRGKMNKRRDGSTQIIIPPGADYAALMEAQQSALSPMKLNGF